jgi:hypothetical protein
MPAEVATCAGQKRNYRRAPELAPRDEDDEEEERIEPPEEYPAEEREGE